MVLQVAQNMDKEKEEYSEVPLPLPTDGSQISDTETQAESTIRRPKKKLQVCKVFSIALNLALILAVILLAVKVCSLKRQIRDLQEREEFEVQPTNVVDQDQEMDIHAKVDNDAQDRILKMQETYGNNWYTEIRIILCFKRPRSDRKGMWGW